MQEGKGLMKSIQSFSLGSSISACIYTFLLGSPISNMFTCNCIQFTKVQTNNSALLSASLGLIYS